ncbi:hypothetical protein Lser_V15G01262 [Lactuca serriola]
MWIDRNDSEKETEEVKREGFGAIFCYIPNKSVSMSATVISSNGSQLAVYQKLIKSIRGNRKEVCESGHYQ